MSYFPEGIKADEPHFCYAASGTEGRCELCGADSEHPVHALYEARTSEQALERIVKHRYDLLLALQSIKRQADRMFRL